MTARPGGDGNTARRFPHRRPHRRPPSTVSQTPAASAEAPDRAVTDSPPLERASQTLPCSSRAAHLPDLISFDPVAFSSPPAREDPKPAFPARAKQTSEKRRLTRTSQLEWADSMQHHTCRHRGPRRAWAPARTRSKMHLGITKEKTSCTTHCRARQRKPGTAAHACR